MVRYMFIVQPILYLRPGTNRSIKAAPKVDFIAGKNPTFKLWAKLLPFSILKVYSGLLKKQSHEKYG